MSQQDVQTIRGAYEAFARQDIAGVIAALDDAVVWDVPESLPWGGVYRGHEEVGAFFAKLAEHLESLDANPEKLLDAGDHVVALGTLRGEAAGGAFEARFAMVWEMRDGKAVGFKEHSDTAPMVSALEAAPA